MMMHSLRSRLQFQALYGTTDTWNGSYLAVMVSTAALTRSLVIIRMLQRQRVFEILSRPETLTTYDAVNGFAVHDL
jgi:hypothetical protein